MNSMQIKCVISLGKTKSYTKTAEDLYVSQSTVSKNINRLEDELGFKITYMQGHQLYFTEQGEYFFQHLTTLHQSYEEMLSNIYSSQSDRPIIIRHSMVPFERYYLPRFLQLFEEKSHRKITLAGFRPYNSYEDNIDLFYENQADFILIQHDFFHNDPRIAFTPLMKSQYSVIINRDNPLSKKQNLNIADLNDQHVYIWNSNPGVDSVLEIERLLKKIMPENNITEVTGLISAEMYATANKGIGIVPSFAYDNRTNPHITYNYLNLNFPIYYGVFYLKSTQKKSFFNDAIKCLKTAFDQERENWH